MPDDVVTDVTPDPVDPDTPPVVDDVVPDSVEPEDEPRPAFVDEILDKIDSLIQSASGGAVDDASQEIPGDGEVIPDENPVRKPWTHRGFFSKD